MSAPKLVKVEEGTMDEGQATLPALPSAHQVHSDTYANDTQINLARFQSGKVTLQQELDGMQQLYDNESADLARKDGERLEKHNAAKADVLLRIKDMDRGISMATAALDKAEEIKL